jgi:hypothetical protein
MLAFLALLAVAPPLADDKTYQDGVRLLDEFEYEAAVAKLKEAAADTTRSPVDRATVLVYLGVAYAELRDETQALKSFEDAVALHPLVVTLASRATAPPIAAVAPVATTAPPTTSAAPPPASSPPKPAAQPSEPGGGGGVGPILLWTGVAGLAAGVVVGVAGLVALAGSGGLIVYALSPLVPYQDDAYELVSYGTYSAIAGGALLALAVVALAAGGGVAGASFVVE